MLLVQINPRRQRNMLISRGGLLQRNRRWQVWRGGRRDRCQGVLQQGLQRLRRVHQLRQQCRRRERDGRLLQWLWQVSDHNGKKAIATNALHSFKLFQICKKSTVAFLDAKIGGASKVENVFSSNQHKNHNSRWMRWRSPPPRTPTTSQITQTLTVLASNPRTPFKYHQKKLLLTNYELKVIFPICGIQEQAEAKLNGKIFRNG